MFENIIKFFKNNKKKEEIPTSSKDAAKERLHLVLMQDRANVSADFLELMKQEIIEVIKKYIEVDEGAIDVRLTNKENDDGTNGAPALYANIPIKNIKKETNKEERSNSVEENKKSEGKPKKKKPVKKEEEIEKDKEIKEDKKQKKKTGKKQNVKESKKPKTSKVKRYELVSEKKIKTKSKEK